tara:strand:- start:1324 stop:1704 length:381 start_codon:yes stop_codon:yes gene_type:complete
MSYQPTLTAVRRVTVPRRSQASLWRLLLARYSLPLAAVQGRQVSFSALGIILNITGPRWSGYTPTQWLELRACEPWEQDRLRPQPGITLTDGYVNRHSATVDPAGEATATAEAAMVVEDRQPGLCV